MHNQELHMLKLPKCFCFSSASIQWWDNAPVSNFYIIGRKSIARYKIQYQIVRILVLVVGGEKKTKKKHLLVHRKQQCCTELLPVLTKPAALRELNIKIVLIVIGIWPVAVVLAAVINMLTCRYIWQCNVLKSLC